MRHLLLVLAALFAVLAALALISAVVTSSVRQHRRRGVERALSPGSSGERPRSSRVRRAVFLELADRLSGSSLTEGAPWLVEVTDSARRDLAARRWLLRARALRTLQPLGLTDDEVSVGLRDRDPHVRALAATLATGRTEQGVLAQLVTLLEDPTPAVRNAALDALTRRAAHSTPALSAALAATQVLTIGELSDEDDIARRADTMARLAVHSGRSDTAGDDSPDQAAHTHAVGSGVVAVSLPTMPTAGSAATLPRPLRATTMVAAQTRTLLLLLRAVGASAESQLLGQVRPFLTDARPDVRAGAVGTLAVLGEQAALLVPALEDEDGRVRAEAALALGRLGARSQAGVVAHRLSDRDHGVRLAAASALTRMGAAGGLLLRHALAGEDPYAADAARMALGLPPAAT